MLLLLTSLAACNDGAGTKVSVNGDFISRGLDARGGKIEEKAEAVGDSVKRAKRETNHTKRIL
jgi:hypothetical protein